MQRRGQRGFQCLIGFLFSLHIIESVYSFWLGRRRRICQPDIWCGSAHRAPGAASPCRMFLRGYSQLYPETDDWSLHPLPWL